MLLDQQCAKRFVSGHNFSCAEKLSIYLGFRWNETAGLAEQAMMLSAAHSKMQKETSLMKKSIKKPQAKETRPNRTMGIDIGDRWCHYCWLNEDGEVVETGKIRTREKDLREFFEGEKRMRIAM